MKVFIVLLFGWTSLTFADQFQSRLQEIDDIGDTVLLKFDNGRVAFVTQGRKERLPNVGETLWVKLDGRQELLSGSVLDVPPHKEDKQFSWEEPFDPSVVGSSEEVSQIFSRMRRRAQYFSQCYNRAHVWAYEEWKRSGLKSKKLFLFFTSSYIRKYRYKWWFHVSPMVLQRDNGAVVERVMDRYFTRTPRAVKAWTDDFIHSKRVCPVVHRYSDYRDHQQDEHCYLIPVSMYFWQPRDIETQERTGTVKTSFIQCEVNHAYREAF